MTQICTFGSVIKINRGTKNKDTGFCLCTACNSWLSDKKRKGHIDEKSNNRCPKNATEEQILDKVWLYIEGVHDVLTLKPDIPDVEVDTEEYEKHIVTLKEALLQGIRLAYSLDDDEVDAIIKPSDDEGDEIVLFETAEGGTGVLESITNENRFLTLALIHDIGKLQSDIGWLGRIFADLGLNKTFTAERYKNHESYGYMIIKNHIGSNNIINDYKMSILDDRHKYLNRCDY